MAIIHPGRVSTTDNPFGANRELHVLAAESHNTSIRAMKTWVSIQNRLITPRSVVQIHPSLPRIAQTQGSILLWH